MKHHVFFETPFNDLNKWAWRIHSKTIYYHTVNIAHRKYDTQKIRHTENMTTKIWGKENVEFPLTFPTC